MSTDIKEISRLVEDVRKAFKQGKTRSLEWRKQQLKQLSLMISENRADWEKALEIDLGIKNDFMRSVQLDNCVKLPLKFIDKVNEFSKTEPRGTGMLLKPGTSEIRKEPLGVVLLISPFNYPVLLLIEPLVGAISSGNAAILKPSEITPNVAECFAKFVPKYLDNDCIKVVLGGVQEATELLKQRFDYIFYTGNGTVGRIVMKAASENLTPVTLELGGKSPCVVDADCNLDVAAKRIIWGKFLNCGQTCVAPDYVLAVKSIEPQLINALTKTIKEFYGDNPQNHPDYTRMVNPRHTQRVVDMIEKSKKQAEIVLGGVWDINDRYVAPTILKNVSPDSELMKSEIFGPVLPIIAVNDIKEACEFINRREKPLALYIFTDNKAKQDYILENTSSGGACVNDVVMHLANEQLPFGGVGESGFGCYHDEFTFNTFSHQKSVLKRSFRFDSDFRYPPYTPQKMQTLKKFQNMKIPKHLLIGTSVVLAVGLAVIFKKTSAGQEVLDRARNFAVNALRWMIGLLEK
jgi:aldehyde dehydrogenase (NAD+)